MKTPKTYRMIALFAFIGTACVTGCAQHGKSLTPIRDDIKDLKNRVSNIEKFKKDGTGCYTVYEVPDTTPHVELNDEFCVTSKNDKTWLHPGVGMDNWVPKKIRLNPTADPNVFSFDVKIVNHGGGGSDVDHKNLYTIKFLPTTREAEIVAPDIGDHLHGGVAHSIQ